MGDEPKDEGGFDWDKLCEGVAPTLDVETLAGDLRDSYLQRFKSKKVPWQHLTEQEQNAEITEGREWAMKLVRQVVHAVARRGFATIPVAIKKWQVKDAAWGSRHARSCESVGVRWREEQAASRQGSARSSDGRQSERAARSASRS